MPTGTSGEVSTTITNSLRAASYAAIPICSHGTSERVSRWMSLSACVSSGRALIAFVRRCTSCRLSPTAACRTSQCVSTAMKVSTSAPAIIERGVVWL